MRTLPLATLMLAAAAACGASVPTVATIPGSAIPSASALPDAAAFANENIDAAVLSAPASSASAETVANGPTSEPDASASASACNEQPPQDFLVRGNFLKAGPGGHERAIQYRTDQYGYFKGFGHPGEAAQPPSAYVVDTTFMGLPVKMHRRVVPALKCAEQEIRRACADHPYTPRALAGIRYKNTYRGGEVTNHAYGIAIDIDPAINTCCGCVKPWNDAPACKRSAVTEYDRMAMPECWVHAFERFGFYWLGHDVLRDTMHFEFLGDPDRIERGTNARVQTGQ